MCTVNKFWLSFVLLGASIAQVQVNGPTQLASGVTVSPSNPSCYTENGTLVCPTLGSVVFSETFESGTTTMGASVMGSSCSFGNALVVNTKSYQGTYAGYGHYTEDVVGPCPTGTTTAHQDRNIYHLKDYGSGNGLFEFYQRGFFWWGQPAVSTTTNFQRKVFYIDPSLPGSDVVLTTFGCDSGANFGLTMLVASRTIPSGANEVTNEAGACGNGGSIANFARSEWCYVEWHAKPKTALGANDSVLEVWRKCPSLDPLYAKKIFKKTTWPAQIAIASASRTSNVSTYNTSTAHGLTTGNSVEVYSMTDSTFNRAPCAVTVVDSDTFTCSNTGADTASGGTGTVGKVCATGTSFTCPAFPPDAEINDPYQIFGFGYQVDRLVLVQFDEERWWDNLALATNGWIGPNQ